MTTSIKPSSTTSLTRRIAGLWMVVLALGLAVVGVYLAVQQGQSLVIRLMEPAQMKTRQIAETAHQQFMGRLSVGFDRFSRFVQEGYDSPWRPLVNFPKWMDGLYVLDGRFPHVVITPDTHTQELFELVKERIGDRLQQWADNPRVKHEFVHGRVGNDPGQPAVFAYTDALDRSGRSVLLVAHIDLNGVRHELIDPLLPSDGAFELIDMRDDTIVNRWSQQLFGALRYWVVQPTSTFIAAQRASVYRQTVFQLALPVLALITMIIAMGILVRAVRRDIALASMKSNFVADVSHELKTPLALIRLYGETLQSGRINTEEKKNEYYDVIMRESTRLTNLINNILDFSRIEAGQKMYTLTPIDITLVVKETYEAYTAQLVQANFAHQLSMEESLPLVEADRDAIAQVIINLINNAIKYSDQERYLSIEVNGDVLRGRQGVLISVHDRGIGISPEDRAHLFEGFFRASDPRVREKGGAGLGLRLVKHIVESHGGSLDVESRLVKGSTFRVFLPAAELMNPTDSESDRADDGQNRA